MIRDSIFIHPPELSPRDQEYCVLLHPPEAVPVHFVSATIPTVSVELTRLTEGRGPDDRRKGIDTVLARLWAMNLFVKDYVAEYLRYLHRRNCKIITLRMSLTAIGLFLGFIEGLGKTQLEQITKQDLEAFVEHEQDRGLKIASVRTRLGLIYAFLRFLADRGVVEPELLIKKIRLRLPELLPKAMCPDDVRRLLSVIDDTRDRAMILVLLRTGMRIGELLATRVGDVNIEERKITIYEGEKNRLGRVVHMSDDAVYALRVWLRKRDGDKPFLFYARGRNILTYSGARIRFHKCLERAGIAHKGYTLHCLRHTFASELLNAGMPLECLQELLGHSSAEVTRRYARLTNKTREEQYFKAMAIIERGELDGDYRLDS